MAAPAFHTAYSYALAVLQPIPGVEYDPRRFGARCDLCVLREWRDGGPIPPEISQRPIAIMIGEAPGGEECKEKRPFVGPSGREATAGLAAVGVRRGDVSWTNALACRPEDNNLDRINARFQEWNRARRAKGEPPLPHPIDCCRPRVRFELASHVAAGCSNIIAFGKVGVQAVTHKSNAITEIQGGPIKGWLDADGGWWDEATPPLISDSVDSTGASKAPPLALRVMPVVHPAFVVRRQRWREAFLTALGRGFRWFAGKLNWTDPKLIARPSPDQLLAYLSSPAPYRSVDVETARTATGSYDPMLAPMRCIGIGTLTEGVVIPFLSVDGTSRFYTLDEEAKIRSILRWYLESSDHLKVGWNVGSYDFLSIKWQLGIELRNFVDGLLLHAVVASEQQHRLAYVGSVLTDVHSWKAGNTAVEARTDMELFKYNNIDDAVTFACIEPLRQRVEEKQARINKALPDAASYPSQWSLVALDHRRQAWAVGMHENGMLVDQTRRAQHDRELLGKAKDALVKLRAAAGNPLFGRGKEDRKGHNPNSVFQVRELAFSRWGLSPLEFSKKSGSASVGDATVRHYMFDQTLTEAQRAYFQQLRWYRRWSKFRGTFVTKIRPPGEPVEALDLSFDAEAEDADEELREEMGYAPGYADAADFLRKLTGKRRASGVSILAPDGRVHADWLSHGTTSGRYSCSHVNLQNQPRVLRDMYVAGPGRVLVVCDADQVELRYVSVLAGAQKYLEVFAAPKPCKACKGAKDVHCPICDPHTLTAVMVFGKAFLDATFEVQERIRDFSKMFSYAAVYGAEAETILDILQSAENKKGDLVYADLKLVEARTRRKKWLEAVPEIGAWHKWQPEEFYRQGFLIEPVGGRTREFLDAGGGKDDEIENELRNFPVQSACASLVSLAMRDLIDGPGAPLPFRRWGPGTGLFEHGHDALGFEVPIEFAEWTAGVVKEAMTRTCRIRGREMKFTAKAKIAWPGKDGLSRWSDA